MRLFLALVLSCLTASAQSVFPFPGGITYISGGGTVTLGNQTTGTTLTTGTNGIAIVPIIMYGGGSGYTLSSFNFKVSTASGQAIAGIYSSGTSSCPSGASLCAASLLCSASAITDTSGTNTISAASFSACGTFAANKYYYLVVMGSNGTLALNSTTGSYCPGTGFFYLTASNASFALPATMGTQSEPSAAQCPAIYATFNCTGACSTAPYPWAIFTYAGNTAGTTVSTANLVNGTQCLNGTFSGTLTSSTTYQTTQTHAFTNGAQCNGSTYTGGTLSIRRTASSGDVWAYNVNTGTGGSTKADAVFWVYNVSNTLGQGDQFDLGEVGGGQTITFGAYGGATTCGSAAPPCFQVERSGGSTTYWGSVHFASATWYLLALYNLSGGPHQAAVFNTSGVEQVTAANACADGKTICITADASGNPTNMRLLCDGSCASTAGQWFYGPALFDPTAASWNSILAGNVSELFFPDSPKVIGPQLAKLVEDGIIPRAKLTEKGWWSNALLAYVGPAPAHAAGPRAVVERGTGL